MYILETETNFPKEPIVQGGALTLDYVGGFKLFDNLGARQKISVQIANTGIYLTYPISQSLLGKSKGTTVFIPLDSINYVNVYQNSELAEQYQKKSMVKRAAVGSIVGGRRGARLGAVSSLGSKKTVVEANSYNYTLQFNAQGETVECAMKIELTGNVQTRPVDHFNNIALRNLLNQKLVNNGNFSQLNSSTQVVEVANDQTQGGSYDELIKLKSLVDQGVITQDEFDAKKKQLLGI